MIPAVKVDKEALMRDSREMVRKGHRLGLKSMVATLGARHFLDSLEPLKVFGDPPPAMCGVHMFTTGRCGACDARSRAERPRLFGVTLKRFNDYFQYEIAWRPGEEQTVIVLGPGMEKDDAAEALRQAADSLDGRSTAEDY